MKKTLLLFFLLCTTSLLFAQQTFPVDGSHDIRPDQYAFINATIVSSPGKTIANGTLLIKGQNIEAIGKNISVPQGYVVLDLKGQYIYPSFIDAFTSYGFEEQGSSTAGFRRGPQVPLSTKKGAYNWNEAIRPEIQAQSSFAINSKKAEEFKKLGFGIVQSVLRDGIARGTSLVTTLSTRHENESIIVPESGAQYSFSKGSSSNSYPNSLMGSIALLRQTYYDAEWYKTQDKEYNISLKEFNRTQSLPQYFEINDVLDVFRVSSIAKEFGKSYILKSAGNEYQRMNEVKATGSTLIVPINFPKTFDVEDPAAARNISLSQLKHWEMAPGNAAAIAKAGIPFSITSYGLSNSNEFWPNIRKAIAYGLSEEDAFKALTTSPAEILGIANVAGTLEKGKLANFFISSKPIFEEGSTIYENWTQGQRYIVTSQEALDIRGEYLTQIEGLGNVNLSIGGKENSYTGTISSSGDSTKTKVKITRNGSVLSLSFNPKGSQGSTRISAYVSEQQPLQLKGELVNPVGNTSAWMASYSKAVAENTKKETPKKEVDVGSLGVSFLILLAIHPHGWRAIAKLLRKTLKKKRLKKKLT